MKIKGFSLVELIFVIAILGILVSIAYPSYREYTNRERRIDGQLALLDLAARMEKYYGLQNSYLYATIGTGSTTDIGTDAFSPQGWYQLSISNQTVASYTLQATPTKAQATNDNSCQSLTLNSLGVKGITIGPAGAPTAEVKDCW